MKNCCIESCYRNVADDPRGLQIKAGFHACVIYSPHTHSHPQAHPGQHRHAIIMNTLTDVSTKHETGSVIIFAQASRVMSEVIYIDTRISFQNGLVQQYRLRVSGV